MTWVGIYLIVFISLGIVLNFYYAGRGGVEHTPGELVLGGLWAIANLLLIIFIGTGSL